MKKSALITWTKEYKRLPRSLRPWIKTLIEGSKTPRDFSNKLYSLETTLREIAIFAERFYRKNWHSRECECDECIESEYRDLSDF